jgi:hypothetical protein
MGIVRDGGVKPYLSNAGTGLAKGAGQVGVGLAAGLAEKVAPGSIARFSATPTAAKVIDGVTPSNQTQAQYAIVGNAVTSTAVTMGVTGAVGALESAGAASTASNLTAGEIESGLSGATLRTTQSAISAPIVNRDIDMLRAGSEAPAIKVDGDIIVDGNHRYAAGVLEGKPPATTPGTASPSQVPNAKPFSQIKVDSKDWEQ